MQGKLGAMRAVVAVAAIATSAIRVRRGAGQRPGFATAMAHGWPRTEILGQRHLHLRLSLPRLHADAARSRRCRAASMWSGRTSMSACGHLRSTSATCRMPAASTTVADIEVDPYVGVKRNVWGTKVDLRAHVLLLSGLVRHFECRQGLGQKPRLLRGHDRLQPRNPSGPDARPPPSTTRRTIRAASGQNWVFETGFARKLGTRHGITPSFSAMLGAN